MSNVSAIFHFKSFDKFLKILYFLFVFSYHPLYFLGYDIRTKEAYEKTMSEFEKIIGFKYLRGVHLNDSRGSP